MAKKGVVSRTPGVYQSVSMILSIKFGSECAYVGENAFKDCQYLSEINDDNILEKIGSFAFAGTKLKSARFDNLSELHNNAFKGCADLNYISMPKCKDIPNEAFANCTSLASIEFPNFSEKTIIGSSAFAGCKGLKTVINNSSEIEIQDSAFCKCVNLNEIKLDNCIEIGKSAFLDCSNIKQITLNKCNTIEEDAFRNCTNLKNVYITIGEYGSCDLKGSNAFRVGKDKTTKNSHINIFVDEHFYTKYIESSTTNNWLEYYQDNIVKTVGCNQIIYSSIDNSPIKLNLDDDSITNEYYNTYGIITFNNDITSLNSDLFSDDDKKKLISITLPSTCTVIGQQTFSGCENLQNITLPNTITDIGTGAFKNCKSLTSFRLPDHITELGDGIFTGCENIEKFEGKITTYGGKAVVLNGTLICFAPKSDDLICNISEINGNIHTLGANCFSGCKNIRRVNMHEKIKDIGSRAFADCTNLREVHFVGRDVPQMRDEVFLNCKLDLLKIFVPEQYFEAYYTNWNYSNANIYLSNVYPMAYDKSIIYCTNTNENITLNNANGITTTQKTVGERTYFLTSNNISNIPANCFNNSSVSEVVLGEKVTVINSSAFKNCLNLKYIYLSDNITKLGDECFLGCNSLQNIHIPQKAYDFGNYIFFDCSALKEFVTYQKEFVSKDNRCYIDNGILKFFASGELNATYTIPDSITSIGNMAFSGSGITKIILSKSTKSIGNYAFAECKSLKSISQWSGVTTISTCAFKGCSRLETLKIPNNVTSIGNSAFEGCGMTSITIPNSITSIGNSVFKNCVNLTNIIIPNNVTSIGNYAFNRCTNLTSVSIPDSVTSIGTSAFEGCGMTSITIPKKIAYIGNTAFNNCSKLKRVYCKPTIPPHVGIGTFYINDNYSDIKFYVPSSIRYRTTQNWRRYAKYIYGFDQTIMYTSSDNNIVVPYDEKSFGAKKISNTYIDGIGIIDFDNTVTTIGSDAFLDCAKLKTITIPDNVTSIGYCAFYNCINMTKITIPNNVTEIGEGAFQYCESLTSITIPENITSIENQTFYECINLKTITIPKKVTSIGKWAFENCKNLTSVYCNPITPPSIGISTFKGNASDMKIYVHNSYAYKTAPNWSDYANRIHDFGTTIIYTSLDSNIITPYYKDVFGANIVSNIYEDGFGIITFDAPITSIGYCAFWGCENMTSVTIPDSVTSIESGAFTLCGNLRSVVIPDSVSLIGNNIFASCDRLTAIYSKFTSEDNRCLIVNGVLNSFAPSGLTSYIIPNSVTSIGDGAFKGYENLIQITIPNNVTSIGNASFYGCNGLSIVAIPDSVTSIDASAFAHCNNLKSVTIGNSVTSIGQWAFTGCKKLTSVYCKPTIPPTGGYEMFGKSNSVMKIYVPQNSVNAYKTANYWSDYIDSISMYKFSIK